MGPSSEYPSAPVSLEFVIDTNNAVVTWNLNSKTVSADLSDPTSQCPNEFGASLPVDQRKRTILASNRLIGVRQSISTSTQTSLDRIQVTSSDTAINVVILPPRNVTATEKPTAIIAEELIKEDPLTRSTTLTQALAENGLVANTTEVTYTPPPRFNSRPVFLVPQPQPTTQSSTTQSPTDSTTESPTPTSKSQTPSKAQTPTKGSSSPTMKSTPVTAPEVTAADKISLSLSASILLIGLSIFGMIA
jgi:hypothetical protein